MDSNDSAWLQALCFECAAFFVATVLCKTCCMSINKHKKYKHVRLVLVRYK